MDTIKELREKRARKVEEARGELAKITDKTPEGEAKEIEARFDAMMTEAEGFEARAARLERLATAEAGLEERDNRRPTGDTEARGNSGVETPATPEYREAFHAWLAAGGVASEMEPEMRQVLQRGVQRFGKEQRAQIAGTAASGGNLVPDEMMAPIVKAMAAWGPMFDGNVVTELKTDGGGTLPIPTVDDTAKRAAQTATEGATLTDDGGADVSFGKEELGDYMFDTEWLRISVQLMTGSMPDVENLIGELLGERLGRELNRALTVDNGTGAPLGIVPGASVGKTVAAVDALTGDEILDFLHSVDPAYRASPKFAAMFNDTTLLALHKLKDGQGNYLIRTAPDGSGRLAVGAMSVRYHVNQAMANIGASARSMVAGDLGRYYVRKIGSVVVGTIQDKDFWPGIGMAGYARADGGIVDTKAVKALVHPAP